ncbi:MAG: CoA transferase, partial [Dehalococcoidia bacterium]
LADAGWDVVRADLPGTSRMDRAESRWGGGAGGAFGAISAGKRTIRLNNVNTLPEIAAAADVVIGDFSSGGRTAAGLPDEVFPRLSPRLATVSVSPHGLTGPRAESPAAELTMQAASGLMFLTGEYDQPPMQLPPYQAELTGGVAAACAAVAAARLARHTGVRQQADVSIVEALSSHIYQATAAYSYRGTVIRREARVKAGLRMVPASDGFVYCAAGALATQRMDGLAKLIDEPRLNDERFATAEGRMENYDELVALFVPPFRERTAKEWFEAAEALHLTFALVQTVDDLFECPQLSARGLLRDETAPDGRRIKVPGRPFITTSTGPSPGDERPASGVETVDTLDWLDDGAEEGAE